MAEPRTPEREVGDLRPTFAVLCPCARYMYSPNSTGNTQEVVAPTDMTEKLLTGMLSLNKTKTQT